MRIRENKKESCNPLANLKLQTKGGELAMGLCGVPLATQGIRVGVSIFVSS